MKKTTLINNLSELTDVLERLSINEGHMVRMGRGKYAIMRVGADLGFELVEE